MAVESKIFWGKPLPTSFMSRWVRADALPVASVVVVACSLSVVFSNYIGSKDPHVKLSKANRTSNIGWSRYQFSDAEEPALHK